MEYTYPAAFSTSITNAICQILWRFLGCVCKGEVYIVDISSWRYQAGNLRVFFSCLLSDYCSYVCISQIFLLGLSSNHHHGHKTLSGNYGDIILFLCQILLILRKFINNIVFALYLHTEVSRNSTLENI